MTAPINPLRRLIALLPSDHLQVGDVTDTDGGFSTVELPGGSSIVARGSATIGARVFVRGGQIHGPAPALPLVTIDV